MRQRPPLSPARTHSLIATLQCSESWMTQGGFCRRTCGLCPVAPVPQAPTPPFLLAPAPEQTEAANTNEFCKLPVATGPCRAAIPAWFYDAAAATCKPFLYGGCQGNANRFPNYEECEAAARGAC